MMWECISEDNRLYTSANMGHNMLCWTLSSDLKRGYFDDMEADLVTGTSPWFLFFTFFVSFSALTASHNNSNNNTAYMQQNGLIDMCIRLIYASIGLSKNNNYLYTITDRSSLWENTFIELKTVQFRLQNLNRLIFFQAIASQLWPAFKQQIFWL